MGLKRHSEGTTNPFGVVLRYDLGKRLSCMCPCGKEFSLLRGEFKRQKSCGCIKSKRVLCWPSIPTIVPRIYYRNLLKNAESRKLDFTISPTYLDHLFIGQGGMCAISGRPISMGKRKTSGLSGQTASVDRINPFKGYTEGNLQWTHKDINIAKFDKTENEFALNSLIVWDHLGKRLVEKSLPDESKHLTNLIHHAIQEVVPAFLRGQR